FSFNDGTANDSIGTITGTLVNGASVSGGQLVLNNDGTNANPATGQYVSLAADALKTSNFSIESWAIWNGGNALQRIIDEGNQVPNGSGGTNGQGFIILTANRDLRFLGQISLNSWGGASDTTGAAGPLWTTGVQHHIVYTHNYVTG